MVLEDSLFDLPDSLKFKIFWVRYKPPGGYSELGKYDFSTLCWVNKGEKMYPKKLSQPIGQYISQLLKTNLLSEIIVSQAQSALFIQILQ